MRFASGPIVIKYEADQPPLGELKRLAETLSPARREGFELGVEAVVQRLSEQCIHEAIEAKAQEAISEAKATEMRLMALRTDIDSKLTALQERTEKLGAIDPDAQLDSRARSMIALTGALLNLYRKLTAGHDWRAREEVFPDGQLGREMVRAVSYAVWAYATGRPELPVTKEVSE